MQKHPDVKQKADGDARAKTPRSKAAYDKHELRARVAGRKALLEAELARLKALESHTTSTPDQDFITASLAALDGMLVHAGDTISEVTAAELSRWLESTPFVAAK